MTDFLRGFIKSLFINLKISSLYNMHWSYFQVLTLFFIKSLWTDAGADDVDKVVKLTKQQSLTTETNQIKIKKCWRNEITLVEKPDLCERVLHMGICIMIIGIYWHMQTTFPNFPNADRKMSVDISATVAFHINAWTFRPGTSCDISVPT